MRHWHTESGKAMNDDQAERLVSALNRLSALLEQRALRGGLANEGSTQRKAVSVDETPRFRFVWRIVLAAFPSRQ
jgi:hypothetical protein